MSKKFPSINLIKDEKGDLVERIVNWSLSVGRVLVIITELIALGAFLWRFGLDQQLVDLHTQTKQKEAIVFAFKKNEDEYRNLQDRLSVASNFSSIGDKQVEIYKRVLGYATPGVVFNKVSLSEERVAIEINVQSVTSLSNFIDSVKSDPSAASVSIDKIETKTDSSIIVVGITMILKPIPNQYAE